MRLQLRREPVKERAYRPALMCRLQGMNWVVNLEVREELAGAAWEVKQLSSVLEEDDRGLGCWRLSNPLGAVEASDRNRDKSFTFPEEPFRIFKLFGAWLDYGRYVQRLTLGRFLVVAPAEWELKTGDSGIERPIASEYLIGMEYRAHHVMISQQSRAQRVVLSTPDGRQVPVPAGGTI